MNRFVTPCLPQSTELHTPIGKLRLTATEQGIISILFEDDIAGELPHSSAETPSPLLEVLQQLPTAAPEFLRYPNQMDGKLTSDPTRHHLQQAKMQLQQYFAGERQQFSLCLAPAGSHFQQQVWQALYAIPFAHSCSYGVIAKHLANPKAVRAVGAANGRNPIAIVVPCHRVIGANGRLTGYAGGLHRKWWLLQHEARLALNTLVE